LISGVANIFNLIYFEYFEPHEIMIGRDYMSMGKKKLFCGESRMRLAVK